MPNVQQKKFNAGALVALAFIAAMVGVYFIPINFWFRIGIDFLLVALFIFIRRGYGYFYRAATLYKNGNSEKVWILMEKALKVGVDNDRKVSIGSAYVQVGDPKRGIEILEKVMADPKAGSFRNTAAVTCSMGYWRIGEVDKAIGILEELRESGYKDDNLSINLESFLLAKGDLKRAKELITARRKEGVENNGLLDNRGWYYIQMGNWPKAKEVYDELIDDRTAKFPEAYLHGAQVSVHFGDTAQAVDRLGWGISKRFSEICLTRKAYLEQLLSGISNPKTREAFCKAMDEAAVNVSNSRPFPGFDDVEEFDEDDPEVMVPGTQGLKASDEADDIDRSIDDDDREPNTDLDDDDDALAQRLGYTEPADEEIPHTELDEDDEREPNTDLDDEE